ncbi:hypothetical protein LIER_04812 [Lithospermum erythrorhizon]|uniref:Fungal lipase-type domain-containing protein n=1 Tax=Lithospermum erythrorhizon TaxID=34254 RepID=A0AAV3P2Q7_LITER
MESIHQRVETWIRDQRARILKVTWPPQWKMVVRWPWSAGREQRKRIQEEFERKKKQLHHLCNAVQAENVSDLQDILCCMVLSECVYKRPSGEMIRAVNQFKADFGGQIVSLERVQPSGDHVPHRYLLAEAGDTLFAAFIGTKQYKDVMADVNIFQGALFHEDTVDDLHGLDSAGSRQGENQKNSVENVPKSIESKTNEAHSIPKPAVHRGFMARAKGIPALELYRLAQRKRRKLVLCGHSLGGAVAVLATLAILRVVSASSKEIERVQVKCITFSQPPVGNSALRDHVNRRGWQQHFKTYCIPEDLVPRILSPAYFHHYNAQSCSSPADIGTPPSELITNHGSGKLKLDKGETEGEQLVLGLGPVQTSFWRLSKLVPLEAVKKQFYRYTGKVDDPIETSNNSDSSVTPSLDDIATRAQSLEIEEGSDGISLRPLPETEADTSGEAKSGINPGKNNSSSANKRPWRRIPALPSYVPFGQLYILGNSAVESLSGAEYSKLTSVRSVIAEVKERFQSHSMKSYRARFQRIYDLCMNENVSSFPGLEQAQQFPQLQKWLGISLAGTVELGHIVESPVICAATSVVPLGWSGLPREKNGDMLKVDISGFGLHLCTIVEARVDGKWCSTTLESFPSPPTYPQDHGLQPEIQRMRILVGAPVKQQPKHHLEDSLGPIFSSIDSAIADLKAKQIIPSSSNEKFKRPDGLGDFVIFCTNDFSTVSREVHVRTRRVRLIGPEGAGKSSLLKAILDPGRNSNNTYLESLNMDTDVQEGIAGGLCYSDSVGVNLQNLVLEASNFRDELWKGIRDLSKKTDLVVLVHNLSHRIPLYASPNTSQVQPALTLLLEEAKSLGIPWVLAITNKFSVSAHQQKAAIKAVLEAYHALPGTTEIVNSFPYIMPTASDASLNWGAGDSESDVKMGAQKLIFAPLDMVRRSFQKRAAVLPVDGVTPLCELIHRVLRDHEEAALEELARDRLFVGLAQQRALAAHANGEALAKENSYNAAAVGASVGAGLGIILAVVMGAASALRKP